MINNQPFQSLSPVCVSKFYANTHVCISKVWKKEKMNKSNCAYFVAHSRDRQRLKSLKWGPLIIGPARCLSRQPFPGTLLEMSTAGNWIRLAVREECQLTDAQSRETLKWQMFPLLLKPECKAVTSRYRLSHRIWGFWQSSGYLNPQRREGEGGLTPGARSVGEGGCLCFVQ